MQTTITTSKESVRASSRILKALARKRERFYNQNEPKSEYVLECLSKEYFASDTREVLGVAGYDNNTFAVIAPDVLSLDARNRLFEAFAENFDSENDGTIIVFSRLDFNSAKQAFSGKDVDINLVN